MRATDDAAMIVTSAVAIIRDARAHFRPRRGQLILGHRPPIK